DILTRV
nr:methionine amino peptidase [Bacillus subtilis] [Bacillus subtilis subsp. subtilis str. 168]